MVALGPNFVNQGVPPNVEHDVLYFISQALSTGLIGPHCQESFKLHFRPCFWRHSDKDRDGVKFMVPSSKDRMPVAL